MVKAEEFDINKLIGECERVAAEKGLDNETATLLELPDCDLEEFIRALSVEMHKDNNVFGIIKGLRFSARDLLVNGEDAIWQEVVGYTRSDYKLLLAREIVSDPTVFDNETADKLVVGGGLDKAVAALQTEMYGGNNVQLEGFAHKHSVYDLFTYGEDSIWLKETGYARSVHGQISAIAHHEAKKELMGVAEEIIYSEEKDVGAKPD